MRKILIPENSQNNSTIEIRGNQFHHLAHVLRIKRGETLIGISRGGSLFELYVHRIESDTIILKPIREIETGEMQKKRGVQINLYQAIPKLKKMDTIIRQSVEIGVTKIIPLITQYTISIPKEEKEISNKITRWQKIVNEAVEQSGNLNFPTVLRPIKFKSLLEIIEKSKNNPERNDVFLLFHPQNQLSVGITLHEILFRSLKTINILIGPEGGFSPVEVNNALKAGAFCISAGNTILRTETAAIFALSAISIILHEKQAWTVKHPEAKNNKNLEIIGER